ncbi:MAG: hypothetical protein QW728_06735, partial [Thermoplasmata archaeon]
MASDIDVLKSKEKVKKLRGIRTIVNILFMVVMIAIAVWMAYLFGFTLKPFYFPLKQVLMVFFSFILFFSILGTVFKIVEIKAVDTESEKYFLARNEERLDRTMAIVFLLFTVAFILVAYNPLHDTLIVKNIKKVEEGNLAKADVFSFSFHSNEDRMRITDVTGIWANSTWAANFTLMTEENFTKCREDKTPYRDRKLANLAWDKYPSETFVCTFPDGLTDHSGSQTYVLVIEA